MSDPISMPSERALIDAWRFGYARTDWHRFRGIAQAVLALPPVAIPRDLYYEDFGAVLWWRFPINEPPYCGSPLDSDWPGYHTHFTHLGPPPVPPSQEGT